MARRSVTPVRQSDDLVLGLVEDITHALTSDLDPHILAGLLLEGAVQAIGTITPDDAQVAARYAFVRLALERLRIEPMRLH